MNELEEKLSQINLVSPSDTYLSEGLAIINQGTKKPAYVVWGLAASLIVSLGLNLILVVEEMQQSPHIAVQSDESANLKTEHQNNTYVTLEAVYSIGNQNSAETIRWN